MAKTLTRRVVSAITLLGSTQGLNMVCNVIRMKILSVLIGPAGVGLMGALSQASDLIGNLTQLNIRTSAVPQLASSPPERFNDLLLATRRCSWLLGFIGTALMFFLAPLLSSFTFGSTEYAWAYRIVSIALLLKAAQGAELVAMQAAGRYKTIAASGLFTAIGGLLLALPLYYCLREDGIAPAIVGYALFAWLGALWFTRNYPKPTINLSWLKSIRLGRGFIIVGALLTVTYLANDIVNFCFLAIIRAIGGEDSLGIYQGGYTLVWRYTSVFFMAFSMEFYPRLIKVIHRPSHASLLLSHQIAVSSRMMFPCSAAIIILAPWIIRLLFSADFLPALPYVIWGMVAMSFRPASMSMSYSFLAAGRNKLYCFTEITGAIIGLTLNSIAFNLGGFNALGISTVLWLLIELAIMLCAARFTKAPLPSARVILSTLGLSAILAALAAICTFVFLTDFA